MLPKPHDADVPASAATSLVLHAGSAIADACPAVAPASAAATATHPPIRLIAEVPRMTFSPAVVVRNGGGSYGTGASPSTGNRSLGNQPRTGALVRARAGAMIASAMATTYRPPGLVVVEHEFDVPLDHSQPDGDQISVFAREVADTDGTDRPFLVFFQGGPGSESPRPTSAPASPGWMGRALEEFRVLMLDQRGTGRSTPIGALEGRSPSEQAEYLTHFRADSIVR